MPTTVILFGRQGMKQKNTLFQASLAIKYAFNQRGEKDIKKM